MKNILPILFVLLIINTNHINAQVISTYAGNGTTGFSGDGGAATSAAVQGPWGVATDASGNLFIADFPNSRIRMVNATTGIITTVCGTGGYGYTGDGGPATAATMTHCTDLVGYGSNVFFIDIYNCVVREITGGIVKRVVGTGVCGYSGDGGQATAAQMGVDNGIAVDVSGNLYITEQSAEVVRKVDMSTGIISTIAGTPYVAGYSGDGGPATAAKFHLPNGIVVDRSGNIFLSDNVNNAVRRIDASTGIITTLAGTGVAGYSGDGGAATAATLHNPGGVDFDAAGNIYIGDSYNNVVRKVNPSGIISTWAGTGTAGFTGDGGAPALAELNYPDYLAHDACGNEYIGDMSNNRIRKVAPQYAIGGPSSVCVSSTITLTDTTSGGTWSSSNPAIAIVGSLTGVVTGISPGIDTITYTFGGCTATTVITVNPAPLPITGLSVVCSGSSITLSDLTPGGMWSASNFNATIVAGLVTGLSAGVDTISYSFGMGCGATKIITVNPMPAAITGAGGMIITFAGTGVAGYNGDGIAATSAKLSGPWGVAVDGAGNVYIADGWNERIRKVNSSGIISTIAGYSATGYSGDGGPATAAKLDNPYSIALDGSGNIYIADGYNNCVRKVNSLGIINTIAGTGTGGYSGDGGPGTAAKLQSPQGVAVDGSGNVYIADAGNHRIRIVNSLGVISTFAGNGAGGYSGDGMAATAAELYLPSDVAVDGTGNVYIADRANERIRKVNSLGIISTIAGNGTGGFSGDGGAATSAELNFPTGVTVDGAGNVYVGDNDNNRIRKVNTSGIISTFAGNGAIGSYSGDGGPPTAAALNGPKGIAVDGSGDVYIADVANERVRKVLPGSPTAVCVGSTITMSDAVSGGVWSSSNPAVATIGPSTGILTGISAGTATISYTLSGGCGVTTVVTVNPSPSLFTMTGGGMYCAGGVGVAVGLSGSTVGVTYQLYNGITPIGSSMGGTGGALSFGPQTAAGTYTVVATLGGCTRTMSGSAVVAINPLPTRYPVYIGVFGIDTLCAITSGSHIFLGGSDVGVTYQLWFMGVVLSPPIAGTGTSLDFGSWTLSGTYTIVGVNSITGCTVTMGTAVILPSPAPISGVSSICGGATTTTYTDSTPGGTWSISAPAIATIGLSSGIVTPVATGCVTITYTVGGCYVTHPLCISTSPTPITGASSVCVGGNTTLSSTPTGGLWTASNTNASIGSSSGSVTGVSVGVTTITYTLTGGCYATKTVTVSLGGVITGTVTVCVGATTTLSSSTLSPTWSSSSPAVATIGSTTGIVTGVAPGTCTIICGGIGCAATTVVTVNPLPALFTILGGGSYCSGTSGVHIGLSGSVPGVYYQLYDGITIVGAPVPGTGTAIDFGLQTAAGTYTVVATIAATGCSRAMSGTVVISISPPPPPIGGPSALCVGATVTETDTTGGTWVSTAPAIATIGPSSGIVNGLTIGTTIISYTLPTGCFTTKTVTVSASPSVINGVSTLCAGDSTTLTDTITGGLWTSSAPSVASVGSLSGLVKGVSAGVVTITYSLGSGCTRTKTMTINASPAAITGSMGLCVGHTTTLACATPGGAWTSGALPVATVGSTGIVNGITAGTAGITYTLTTGCKSTARVTVNALPPVITGTMNVCTGATTTLSDGATGGVWTSSLPGTARVGSTGVVTGVATGTATISYSLGSGCIVTAPVTVNASPAAISGPSALCVSAITTETDPTTPGTWSCVPITVATIGSTGILSGVSGGVATISYTTANGCAATKQITVNALPGPITGSRILCIGQTTALSDTTTGVTWSSGTPAIATIGSLTGIVTGVAAGTATITCFPLTGCYTSITITVNPAPPAITGVGTVCVGSTTTLSDATPGGVWSSASPAIATVVPSTGVVTGLAPGVVTIVDLLPSGCSVSTTVTVNPLPASITGATTVCRGLTATLSDATPGGVWSSGSPTVASIVSTTGVVTGVSAGSTIITYTASTGCRTTMSLSVNPGPANITGGTSSICTGRSTTFTDATPGGVWSSSNTGIATVSPTGVVTGISGGTAIISYAITSGCASVRAVVVTQVPMITGLHNLCAWGDTLTVHDSLTTGLYSSTLVTAMNLGGGSARVLANAPGVGTVTYTLPSGCSVTATVTTNPLPGLITGANHTYVGGTTTLSNIVAGGTWSSGAPTIASVGPATGIVYGVAAGTAYITYTLPVTGCKADTPVHVTAHKPGQTSPQPSPKEREVLSVIPNPNKGEFTITGTLNTTQDEEVMIELTDMLGQVVYKKSVMCRQGIIDEQVTLSDQLANGMYLLSVRSSEEKRVMHVVVGK